jgi:hypothetical protein
VTLPEFMVADPAAPAWRSPLRRALADAPRNVRDVTAEVGEAEAQALGPACGLAGLELEGPDAERAVRRMTDLDLTALPSVGALAHVRALVQRPERERFRIWFAQEYSDYIAEVALDAMAGTVPAMAGTVPARGVR